MPKAIKTEQFRYITPEAWRCLVGVEMGMKNHEVVPPELIQKISKCKKSGSSFVRILKDQLVPNRLVAYEVDSKRASYGYRLTNMGYDYLALHQLIRSDQISNLGAMIGSGKESDVYLALAGASCGRQNDEAVCSKQCDAELPQFGDAVVIKFHRLGRTSFRKVKEKRDYHQHRGTCSWLYLDRLASQREFAMMQALFSAGLSVPCPLAHNRNAVLMSYLDGVVPLCRILPKVLRSNEASISKDLYAQAKHMLLVISSLGLVHGDFNEFNLMVVGSEPVVDDGENTPSEPHMKLVLIDFPQMISRDHKLAEEIYHRDANGVVSFFNRFFVIVDDDLPPSDLSDIKRTGHLDVDLKAPGYIGKSACAGKHRRSESTLLGATAGLSLSSGGSDYESAASEVDSIDASEDDDGDEYPSEEIESDDANCNSTDTSHSTKPTRKALKQKHKEDIHVIGTDEIRQKQRLERRRIQQADFLRRVKRQSRANIKQQGRAAVKAEEILFG